MIVKKINNDEISFQPENDKERDILHLTQIRRIKNMRFINLQKPLEKWIITLRPYPPEE